MTLPASYRNDRVGDGTTTIFPYTFKVWAAEEMRVVLTDPDTGVVTEPTSGFSVTGVGSDGGNVVFDVAPVADTPIVFLPTTTYEQDHDLVNETQFFQERIEDGLDKLCRQSQLLKEEASRTLRIPESEVGGDVFTLPSAADRANQGLGFDDAGDLVIGTFGTVTSAAMQPVVSSATLDAARLALGVPYYESTDVIALYVDPVGSDANDGLSALAPKQTIQAAIDVISGERLGVTGRFVVNLAAGTYTNGAIISGLRPRDYRIVIQGPTVALNSAPTAIIDGTTASTDDGLYIEQSSNIEIRHVAITNFSTNALSSSGVEIVTSSGVRLYNVHVSSCGIGYYARNMASYQSTGGKIDLCTHGVLELFSVVRNAKTVSVLADGLQITNCTYGVFAKEMCTGHLDYTSISDCTYGIFFSRDCSANITSGLIQRCSYGAVLRSASQIVDLSVDWGIGTADKNTVAPWVMDHSSNIVTTEQIVGSVSGFLGCGERILASAAPDPAPSHTGDTVSTVKWTSPALMLKGVLHYPGTLLRFRMSGTKTGTAGAVTLDFRFGNSTALALTIPATATSWIAEYVLVSQGVDKQIVSGDIRTTAGSSVSRATRTYAVSAGNFSVAARVTLANAADSVAIESATVSTTDRLPEESN